MKIKDYIKELKKLDGEATIGTVNEDSWEQRCNYFVCGQIQILPKSDYERIMEKRGIDKGEDSEEVDYVIW